jgi:hypothetical protein
MLTFIFSLKQIFRPLIITILVPINEIMMNHYNYPFMYFCFNLLFTFVMV